MTVSASDLNRALQDRVIVQTHVPHIVSEDEPQRDGAIQTVCGYYLTEDQYTCRFAWTDEYISVTHICRHCRNDLRESL